jgi:hypothetical protein
MGTLRELSLEPLTEAQLAMLEHRVAAFNPFTGELSGPPHASLQAAMHDHLLSNGQRSPWLQEFLNRAGQPLKRWNNTLIVGSADDPAYIDELVRSARSTVLHQLLNKNRYLGETWSDFLDRLFRQEWLPEFRRLATERSGSQPWHRDNFVAVGLAVCEQLRREGYRLSVDEQELARLWESA